MYRLIHSHKYDNRKKYNTCLILCILFSITIAYLNRWNSCITHVMYNVKFCKYCLTSHMKYSVL